MKIVINTDVYNERRYGKPWIAKVTFVGNKANFDWGDWVGEIGYKGFLIVNAEDGDIVAIGQKDNRKPANSAPRYYIIKNVGDTKSIEIEDQAIATLEETGFFEYVSKSEAFKRSGGV